MNKHFCKGASIAALAVASTLAFNAYADVGSYPEITPDNCADHEGCTIENGTLTIGGDSSPAYTLRLSPNDKIKVTNIVNNNVLYITGTGSIVAETGHAIVNNGTLLVESGSDITIDAKAHGMAALWNNKQAVLDGGRYIRSQEAGRCKSNQGAGCNGNNSYYTIVNHGAMTVNNGVVVENGNGSTTGKYSSMFENGYSSYNSKNQSSGYVEGINQPEPKLTINGGTFKGGLNTIKNDDMATIEIKGGSFSNFAQAVFQNHHIATVEDGYFDGTKAEMLLDNCGCDTVYDKGQLTILGGTFIASTEPGTRFIAHEQLDGSAPVAGSFVKISGGTFNNVSTINSAFIESGYQFNTTSTGGVVVPERSTIEDSNDTTTVDTSESVDSVKAGITNTDELKQLVLEQLSKTVGIGDYTVALVATPKANYRDDLDDAAEASLTEALAGLETIGIFDISINWSDGTANGSVTELESPIELTVLIPEEYQKAPEGYTRKFYVVRIHENADGSFQIDTIPATSHNDGAYITFNNRLFSDAIVTYADEKNATTIGAAKGGFESIAESTASANSNGSILGITALAVISFALGATLFRIAKSHAE